MEKWLYKLPWTIPGGWAITISLYNYKIVQMTVFVGQLTLMTRFIEEKPELWAEDIAED